ncbi:hypothetical protein [Microbispora sp. NPDC049125]|uniref:hypothetical protein n=1 Tax=Microbispora sp. NPDC049125 TaxID=3154929 RepID=UPI003465C25F
MRFLAGASFVTTVWALLPAWLVDVATAGQTLDRTRRGELIEDTRMFVGALIVAVVIVDRCVVWRDRSQGRSRR